MNRRLKTAIKYFLYFSPAPLKKYVHKKIDARILADSMERFKRCKVSKEEVEAVLSQIDFDSDIMLHTSTMNIGRVAGGVKWLTDQILSRCDLEHHTLLVSALPFFGSFAEYLHDGMTFDVRTAPIAMGAINERIAAMPEARRSAHPTHSVAAIGKDADFYTGTHHLDKTPFGPNSPYFKLLQRKAKVLLFGATMNNITFIHAIEDALGDAYPVKHIYSKRRYSIDCVTADGEKVTVDTPVHDPFTSIRRDSNFLFDDGLRHGYLKAWKLGEGYVALLDTEAFTARYVEMLKKGESIYGRCRKLGKDIELRFCEF